MVRTPSRCSIASLLSFALLGCGGSSNSDATADAGLPPADGNAGDTPVTPSCPSPKTTCGASCVDTTTDGNNCGSCGQACGSDRICCGGSCSTSCALSIASVSADHGPVAGGTWLTIVGRGFAKGARVFFGDSRAPALVIDDATIRAQTAPHVDATVDVRVEQGAQKTTRGAAFRYAPYGFEGPWQKVGLKTGRGELALSVLQDGRALITGGISSTLHTTVSTAELFDPVSSTTSPTVGAMSDTHAMHTQVTMLSGKVLVLGMWFADPVATHADAFDPTTSTFKTTSGKPSAAHIWPHAVLLADGRVLVASSSIASVDLYDPSTDAFSLAPAAPDCRGYRPARLLDGRVALVAGAHATVRIFDPETSAWSDAGPGPTAVNGDVFTLPDGCVLYLGGSNGTQGMTESGTYPSDAIEVFDPTKTSGFAPLLELVQPRNWPSAAMLGDGSLLTIGGNVGVTFPLCTDTGWILTEKVERIDPVAVKIAAFDALAEKNATMAAVTMQDGSVVAAGGVPCGTASEAYPYFYFLKGKPPVIK